MIHLCNHPNIINKLNAKSIQSRRYDVDDLRALDQNQLKIALKSVYPGLNINNIKIGAGTKWTSGYLARGGGKREFFDVIQTENSMLAIDPEVIGFEVKSNGQIVAKYKDGLEATIVNGAGVEKREGN